MYWEKMVELYCIYYIINQHLISLKQLKIPIAIWYENLIPESDCTNCVIVPTVRLPLSDAQLHQLETEVDPMAESDYGVIALLVPI